MPQEPKKRHSRARQGKRRAAIHLAVSKTIVCPNCQTAIVAHKVCRNCGFYKGKEVINKTKKDKKQKEEVSETKNEKSS
jgi:large subunit ribosomal protein L32